MKDFRFDVGVWRGSLQYYWAISFQNFERKDITIVDPKGNITYSDNSCFDSNSF